MNWPDIRKAEVNSRSSRSKNRQRTFEHSNFRCFIVVEVLYCIFLPILPTVWLQKEIILKSLLQLFFFFMQFYISHLIDGSARENLCV